MSISKYHQHRQGCKLNFAPLDSCDCVELNMQESIDMLSSLLVDSEHALRLAGDYIEAYQKNTGIDLGEASRMPYVKDVLLRIDMLLEQLEGKNE